MSKELICPDRLKLDIYMRVMDNPPLTIEDIIAIIDTQTRLPSVPAGADTVVVTRCEDCKYYETEGNYCNRDIVKSLLSTEPTDYCSWAERRKSEC